MTLSTRRPSAFTFKEGDELKQALEAAASALNSTDDTAKVVQRLVELAARALRVKGAAVLLFSRDRSEIFPVAARGLSRRYLAKGPLLADRSLAETLTGAPIYVADTQLDPRVQYPEAAQREGIVSILSLPLRLRDEILGCVRAYAARLKAFGPEEAAFLTALADLAAVALEQGRNQTARLAGDTTFGQELVEWYAAWDLERRRPDQAIRFAHPAEEEFARLLDFYRVRWFYEPRSFPLAWEEGRPTQMFTPDFYLADLDLYVELTTLRQRLVTEKHRKLRRLRELHPEVRCILLHRKDYHRLLTKYGYRPVEEAGVPALDRVLLTESQVQERVAQLGRAIAGDYAGKVPIFVGVLKGVIPFMADLARETPIPLEVDYLALSTFEGTESSAIRILKDLTRPVAGRHVLLVEDIVDTGLTLRQVLEHLRGQRPASLEVCVLLDKRTRRLADVPIKYAGFSIEDVFVVGYGLDYAEAYRNLPLIASLKLPAPTHEKSPE